MHWSQLHGTMVVPTLRSRSSRTSRSHRGSSGTGAGAHVGPDESAKLLDRVARNLHLLLEASVRVNGLLEGLLDTLAGLVHHPAVIHATQAVLLRYAVGKIDAAMGTGALDESERAGLVTIEDEVFAEQAHRLVGLSCISWLVATTCQ